MKRTPQTPSPHSVLMAHCPSRQVLIFALLEKQPTRFNEMQRVIEGISHKMLTQTLRNLERRGIVERKITPTIPPAGRHPDPTHGRPARVG